MKDVNDTGINNKIKLLLVLGTIIIAVLSLTLSYAIFSFDGNGTLLNSITTATVSMTYTEGENKISIENALPLEDEIGKKLTNDNQVFDFTVDIKVTGKQTIAYEVTGEKDSESTLDDNAVRLYLEKSEDKENYKAVQEPSYYVPLLEDDTFGAKKGEMILDTGTVTESKVYYYRLRMWVSKDYKVNDVSNFFTIKVNVYGKDSNTGE